MTVRHRSGGRSDRSADSTRQVSEVLRENVRELKEQAGEQATALTQGLRARGETLLEEQKLRAATEIANLGAAIRRAADKLHDQKSDALARYVDTAAESLNGVARYVVENDLRDLTREIESFARRRPTLIVASMFLAGLAVGRFVKAAQPVQETMSSSSAAGRQSQSQSHASRRNGTSSRNRNHKSSRRPR